MPRSRTLWRATGYVSLAERALPWWGIVAGADWRHLLGPSSGLDGLDTHPVVHIAHEDAQAHADWAGKALPSKAEWEVAARGGLDRATYAGGGDALAHGGAMLANFWQGALPDENGLLDGWARTSPVRSFPANGHGLFDMIGNVWEWTSDWYAVPEARNESADATCCIPRDPRGGTKAGSVDPAAPRASRRRSIQLQRISAVDALFGNRRCSGTMDQSVTGSISIADTIASPRCATKCRSSVSPATVIGKVSRVAVSRAPARVWMS